MDIATIIGIIVGTVLIGLAIVLGGEPLVFVDLLSIFIVVGGTVATTLIRFPFGRLTTTAGVVKHAFSHYLPDPEEVIAELVALARKARQEGLLSLEDYQTDDPFLEQGIQLVVDGNEAEAVEMVLMTDIRYLRQRHRNGQEILKSIGEAAPAFGMIGTLIGLVIMLTNLEDVSTLGPAMAVAILTTLYGALISNLLALPIAKKLEVRSREETLNRELILVGLLNILKGENPRMMETVLRAFLSNRNYSDERRQSKEMRAA
ncbi:MAG TPA: MotA/TolQ/ExbB proton channel family protein [Acidobacteriota bacterium]|nr:MotA/TolQ/ExbB proton channel family protein [Acidobacteriota bacterium]